MQHRAIITRRKILESAVVAFAHKGFNGTTVDSIADSAGVNKQRIYAYFGSKKKLFEAALLEVFLRVRMFGSSTLEKCERNPEQLNRIVLSSFLQVHEQQPVLWRLLAWANLEGGDCVNVLESARNDENNALRKIFDLAVANKFIKPVKFEKWLFILLGISCFYYSNRSTLVHTHDRCIAEDEWKAELISDVDMLLSEKLS